MSEKTIFKQIIDGELPADILFEDEVCLAFRDVNPQAPTHVLVIPKQEIPAVTDISEADTELIGHMFVVIRKLSSDLGLEHGFRVVVNCGKDGGQLVPHLHFHLLGGRQMNWPPG